MEKKILTLAVSALLSQLAIAQESKTTPAIHEEIAPSFNFGIGAIWTRNTQDYYGVLKGFNFKANKILSEKRMLGISMDIGRYSSFEYSDFKDFASGVYTNFFATATYYFFGDATKSKVSMYGQCGFGTVYYNEQNTYTVPPNYYYPYPQTRTLKVSTLNFSAQLCIGSDVRLGKRGKLFAEIVSMPSLFESRSGEGSVTPSVVGYPYSWKEYSNISNNNFTQQLGLRFGFIKNF